MEKYYLKYKNDVFRFVLSIVKDKYLAEDITQECFLKLFENQKNIRDFSKIKTWLFTTARNLSITSLKNKPFLELDDKTLPEESNDNFKYLELISLLSDEEQQLISLRIIGKFKWREIAEILDCSQEMIKKRYQRSLHKLKNSVKEELL